MAEGESSLLSDLVGATVSNSRDFVINGALQSVVDAITGGGDIGKVQDQLDDIAKQLGEIAQTEKAILDELDYIEAKISKDNLMEATATIKSAHESVRLLILAMVNGAYNDKPDELAASYKKIVDEIADSVPKAALLISENAEDFLDQLVGQLRKDKTELLNYYLTLCYAVYKFEEGFQMAITIAEFCSGIYPFMEGYKKDFTDAGIKVFNWKSVYVNGLLCDFVARLVNKDNKAVSTDDRIACFGNPNIDEKERDDASYWLEPTDTNHVVASLMSSDDKCIIFFIKADDFDLQNPLFLLTFVNDLESPLGVGTNEDIITTGDFRKTIVVTEGYDKNTEYWQLSCCESDNIPAPSLKESFCFYNPQHSDDDGHYCVMSVGDWHIRMAKFSESNPQQFWHFVP